MDLSTYNENIRQVFQVIHVWFSFFRSGVSHTCVFFAQKIYKCARYTGNYFQRDFNLRINWYLRCPHHVSRTWNEQKRNIHVVSKTWLKRWSHVTFTWCIMPHDYHYNIQNLISMFKRKSNSKLHNKLCKNQMYTRLGVLVIVIVNQL